MEECFIVAHATLVQTRAHIGVHVREGLLAVKKEELPTGVGGLEADERTQPVSTLECRLIVHADKKLGTRRLVDRLVHRPLLADDRTCADARKRILAGIQAQKRVELLKALLALHELKATEPQSATLLQLRKKRVALRRDPVLLAHRGISMHLDRHRALHCTQLREIDALRIPPGERTFGYLVDRSVEACLFEL